MGTFALGLDAYVLTGLLPGIGSSFGTSPAAAGQVVTGFTVAYALGSPVLSVLSARASRRTVLLVALGIFAAANLASAAAPDLWVLISARVVAGAGAGLYAPSAAAAATGLVAREQRGRALAVVLGGLTIATVLGVPVGLLLGVHVGWRATLLLVAALALAAGAGIAVLLPPITAPPPPGLRERFAALGDRFVLGRVTVMLVLGIANLGLYTYLATVLHHSAQVTTGQLPLYLLVWGVGGGVGNTLIGWLLDQGRDAGQLLTITICLLAVALCLIPVLATGPVGVALVLFAWGFAAWSLQVPLQYQLTTTVPEHAATAVALLASAVYLGSAIGSAGNGILLDATSTAVLPLAAGALALVALGLNQVTAHRVEVSERRATGSLR
ncbi:MFS transporter [Nocardioides sp. KR10-350]|uniref:MFS transporter n=1 Tax=Nocardioides cheoyonin TaxID=3156615 RepID=UPI0032B32690